MAETDIGDGVMAVKMCSSCLHDSGIGKFLDSVGEWFVKSGVEEAIIAVVPKVLFCPDCRERFGATFEPKPGSMW